jgi:uncharacterized RDD family membrane protein YckC
LSRAAHSPDSAARSGLDTLVSAETPEGILLELRPAGVVPRLFAFLLDLAIRGGVLYFAVLATSFADGFGVAVLLVLAFLLEWFYPVAFELALGGATPGKRVMRIRVIMDDGLPVTPAASLTRNLLRVADFLPIGYGFGLVRMLARADFKRLGDLAAGTLVVHAAVAGSRPPLDDVAPLAPPRPLNARERAALIAFAGRAAFLTPERATEVAALTDLSLDATGSPSTLRLVGIARWLLGARPAA